MASQHKLAQNGLGADTALTVEELQSICAQVAPAATGNHWKGKHKTTLIRSDGGTQVYEVRSALLKWDVHMTFAVSIGEENGRRRLITTIGQYKTVQPTVLMFIPTGPKSMTAYHTYVEFLTLLANTVRDADPTAHVSLVTGAHQRAHIPRSRQVAASPPQAAAGPTPGAVVREEAVVQNAATPVDSVPDDTVKVPRLSKEHVWHLEGEGLAPVEIAGRLILGRAPQASAADERSATIETSDPSLSATHAAVEVLEGRLTVTDLGSTNGTVVITDDSTERDCPMGVATDVPPGATVELGAVALIATRTVRRRA